MTLGSNAYIYLSNNLLHDYIGYVGTVRYLDLSYNLLNVSTSIDLRYKLSTGIPNTTVDIRGNRYQTDGSNYFRPGSNGVRYSDPQDEDECVSGRYICPNNSYCSDGWNPPLSYTCSCTYGLRMDRDSGLCVDVNECDNGLWSSIPSNNTGNPCKNKLQCINIFSGFNCCDTGYEALGDLCVDLNECDLGTHSCRSKEQCINTDGSFVCCDDGYRNIGGMCIDINECIENKACGSIDLCLNTNGSYKCCPAGTYNGGIDTGVCLDCYGEWITIRDTSKNDYIKTLNSSLYSYGSCFGPCETGVRIKNRIPKVSVCGSVLVSEEKCSYSCLNYTDVDMAQASILVLYRELMKETFISELLSEYGLVYIGCVLGERSESIKIEYSVSSMKKRDIVGVMGVIESVSEMIVPNAPNMTVENYEGHILIQSKDPPLPYSNSTNNTTIIINKSGGISVAVIAGVVGGLCALMTLMGFLWWNSVRRLLRYLPHDVSWPYRQYTNSIWGSYFYRGGDGTGYYYKDYDTSTSVYQRLMSYDDRLSDMNMSQYISNITLVYNERLLTNFINAYLIQTERFKADPKLFQSRKWDTNNAVGEKKRTVYSLYHTLTQSYSWNRDSSPNIIPVYHGTDRWIAEKICETGFASLSSLDEGWYGKGIYFSTYPMYCSPYFISKKQPSIILSWILPGNVFPVTEGPDDTVSFKGAALKSGYNSHYVCVNKKGYVYNEGDNELYDEIVIAQEAQIVPIAIININQHSVSKISSDWSSI